MANLPEVDSFDAGVYQIETTDPVLGGPSGITNLPLKNLTNRTKWLKSQVDALIAAAAGFINGTQLQAEIEKLAWKAPVRVATTANITLSGTQTIDGVVLAVGNRVLVKDQTSAAQNGIYLVAEGAWTRAADADTATKLVPNSVVEVSEGTSLSDTAWRLSTNGPISVGSTLLAFARIGADLTGYAPLANPTFTGVPAAPTAATGNNTTQLATTAFVVAQIASSVPAASETVAGRVELATAAETTTGTDSTRAVHPAGLKVELDKKAPIASPTFTGNPAAPTAAQFDNDTSLATTEFVQRALGNSRGFIGLTANTTLSATHCGLDIFASTSGAAITLTLPAASALAAGSKFRVMNTGLNDVILSRAGSDTIVLGTTSNTVTSVTLKSGDWIEVASLGTGALWYHTGGTGQLGFAGAFGSSLAANGYQRLPSGLIIQWGQTGTIGIDSSVTVTFPIAFPNACLCAVAQSTLAPGGTNGAAISTRGYTTTTMLVGNDSSAAPASWIAIGY